MGVPSLTTFVDHNQHLLTDFKLHNIKVIVDGNNLYHFLYYYFQVPHEYGGDYDTFANKVQFYFTTLLKCKIQPIILFDGGYDDNYSKLSSTIQRAKDRISNARSCSLGLKRRILPLLSYETFLNVLDELDIVHVTCNFEADAEVAALANYWNCPVMSNDSDFYIFDVKGGFILFDYLNLALQSEQDDLQVEHFYLNAQIYFLDSLLDCFKSMERQMIPLFATLMGNDFVDPAMFNTFFASKEFPKHSVKLKSPQRTEKMINLLTWLDNISSFEEALNSVLTQCPKDKRSHVECIVKKSIENYFNPQSQLINFLLGHEEDHGYLMNKQNQKCYPQWIQLALKKSHIPPNTVNILINRRVMLPTQIENMHVDSAFHCSRYLRQIMYTILLNDDLDNTMDSVLVEEYSRKLQNQKKEKVSQVSHLEDGQSVPNLFVLPNMSEFERASLFMKVLGVDENYLQKYDIFGNDVKVCLGVLPYWITHANPQVSVLHVAAILLTFIKIQILDKLDKSEEDKEDDTLLCNLMEKSPKSTLCKARDSINKLLPDKRTYDKIPNYDAEIAHSYAQFQACLKDAMHLNQVLCCPFTNPVVAKFLNGSCYYHVCNELKQRKCPQLYVQELLVRDSALCQFYQGIYEHVINSVPESSILIPIAGKKKTKKKKNKKKERPSESFLNQASSEEDEETTNVADLYLLDNKFGALLLDD